MTVFVEGGEESGALHTVEFAEQLGTIVGAVPGPVTGPMSAGPNSLLRESSAAVVRGLEDVLSELGLSADTPTLEGFAALDLSPTDRAVLELVAAGDRTPRQIGESLPELAAREISQIVGRLELHGHLVREGSGEYSVRR